MASKNYHYFIKLVNQNVVIKGWNKFVYTLVEEASEGLASVNNRESFWFAILLRVIE